MRIRTMIMCSLLGLALGAAGGAWIGWRIGRGVSLPAPAGQRPAEIAAEIEPAAKAPQAAAAPAKPGTARVVLRSRSAITGQGVPVLFPAPSPTPSPAVHQAETPFSPSPAAADESESTSITSITAITAGPTPDAGSREDAGTGEPPAEQHPAPRAWEGTLEGTQTVTVLGPAGQMLDTADLQVRGEFTATVDAGGNLYLAGELAPEDAVITLGRLPVQYSLLQAEASVLSTGAELGLRLNILRRDWGVAGITIRREWPWAGEPKTVYGVSVVIPIF